MQASAPQVNLISNLLKERKLTTAQRKLAQDALDNGLEMSTASRWIERLLELPRDEQEQGRQKATSPEVEAGRYAVQFDGKLRFFRIDRPDEGRWAGYVFVKEQAGPNLYPVKARMRRNAILDAIARDPKEALLRYGLELGHCGRCGLELTKDESRERGIGPVCAEYLGY